MIKKFFVSFVFAFLLFVLCGASGVYAATYGNLIYEISNGEVTITDCKETATGEIVIPETINGYPVTAIDDFAFYSCSGLTSITIPDGVTSIGDSAFSSCSGLTSITIPDGVTSIGIGAFGYCSGLTSITIPDGVTSIGISAFSRCSGLTNITIPDGVTSIGDYAFWYCSGLTSITIPDGVTSIGDGAFYYCSGLTSITIPDGVTSIGIGAFGYCSGLTSITIPDGVTSIGDSAFYSCSGLTSITIPNSVTSIGGSAFSGCSGLTSITIPDSVTSIGNYAFRGCSNLENVYITDITSWLNIIFGNDTSRPMVYASKLYLNDVLIEELVIPEGITYIPRYAFCDCEYISTVVIPNGVTSIDSFAFYYCSGLKSITMADSVTSIGGGAFEGCSQLISITIPDSVTSIGSSAFSNCSGLTSITLPNSVTAIGNSAFSYCSSLTSITIPDSVASIGDYAFYSCSGLTSITIGNGVTSIGDGAFSYCIGLTSIKIPDGVTSIGDDAFSDCSGLTSITIPDSVTSIGDGAFSCCSGLTIITIGNGVTSIGDDAFSYCIGLTSITIPDSVTSIGNYAFSYCSGLTSMTIPDGVTSIGGEAFSHCSGLTSITIGNGVTSIGDGAFYYCSGLTSIKIPYTVTSIDGNAFDGCDNLKTVYKHHSASWDYDFGDDVEIILYEYDFVITYVLDGEIIASEGLFNGETPKLLTPPYGYRYNYYVDNEEWNGESITEDVTVTVTKTPITYTITYVGDYTGEAKAEYLTGVTLPSAPEGYIYIFTEGEITWSGESIIKDATVNVKMLCDMAELEITNIEDASVNGNEIRGKYYGRKFVPECSISPNATIAVYTDAALSKKVDSVTLQKGINTFYAGVTAESGRKESYTIIIDRAIPETLGELTVVQTVGGNLTMQVGWEIKGAPSLYLYYGYSIDYMTDYAAAEYIKETNTIFAGGLPEGTELYIKIVAIYDECRAESTVVRERTGITLSSDCYIIRTLTPPGGRISHGSSENDMGEVSGLTVTNKFEDIVIDVEVSKGATWGLYRTASSSTEISKTVSLNEGRTVTRYIKVTSEDGEHRKIYSVSIYRQSKSTQPVITVSGQLVTITAEENSTIIYTTDKTEPSENNGTVYTAPFIAQGGTIVKAIARQSGKDEYSDIVIYTLPDNLDINIVPMDDEIYTNSKGYLCYAFNLEAPEAFSGRFVIALYDEDGRFICMETQTISAQTEYYAEGSIKPARTPRQYRAFLWSCENNIAPLTEMVNNLLQ